MSNLIEKLAVKLANKELQIANLEVENDELKEKIAEFSQSSVETKKGGK